MKKKVAIDIKLVFHSSTIKMMHGPINIGFTFITHINFPQLSCKPHFHLFTFIYKFKTVL